MRAGLALDRNLADAQAWSRRSIEANRLFPRSHFALAAALARFGEPDRARLAAEADRSLDPNFTTPPPQQPVE
jgi:hypothetical protein